MDKEKIIRELNTIKSFIDFDGLNDDPDFPYEVKLKSETYDYINPDHYKQDDGKQTWERMIEEYGKFKTAIFCELSAFKYRDRMGRKPNENIEREKGKIEWYDKKALELELEDKTLNK